MAGESYHLYGIRTWLSCDHTGTSLDPESGGVRLAAVEESRAADPVPGDWVDVRRAAAGGAVWLDVTPDEDAIGRAAEITPDGLLRRWVRRTGAWSIESEAPGPLRTAVRDAYGRVWGLTATGSLTFARGDTLATLGTLAVPAGTRRATVDGVTPWIAGDGPWLARLTPEGTWQNVIGPDTPPSSLPAGLTEIVALDARLGELLLLLRAPTEPRGALVRVRGGRIESLPLTGIAEPLAMLAFGDGALLLAESEMGERGPRTAFARYRIEGGLMLRVAALDVVGFEGRALYLGEDGSPWAMTRAGPRPLFARPDVWGWRIGPGAPIRHDGRIETFALDSRRLGNVWHRVFLDACVPEGCQLQVAARTSDRLPAEQRAPLPPVAAGNSTVHARPMTLPLGGEDEDGWMPLPALDRRGPRPDVPILAPTELPSDDRRLRREDPRENAAYRTFEGLIPNPGGRYLWLRVSLLGTRRSTPRLLGIRATFPRPSLLDFLPAFWRTDPVTAATLERTLALFEGPLTELSDRIDALPRLLTAETTPSEALPWLAAILGLSFDERLPESARRQLLAELTVLYRQRGTLPGLERMCTIVVGAPVRIVESWRLRRHTGAVLKGVEDPKGSIMLGPGLGLVDAEEASAAHPLAQWVADSAHRFMVAVFGTRTDDRAALLEAAIEAHKPAHTAHETCWFDTGFRVGMTSVVGLGGALVGCDVGAPGVLSDNSPGLVLGGSDPARPSVLFRAHPSLLAPPVPGALSPSDRS